MMRSFLTALAVTIVIGTAVHAELVATSSNPLGTSVIEPSGTHDATGDTYDEIVGVFDSVGGGALFSGPNVHTFPGPETMGDNAFYVSPTESGSIIASQAPGGPNETIYTFEWTMDNPVALIPAGASPNDPITTISFEMGTANSGGDYLQWDPVMPFVIKAPEAAPGTFAASFELLDLGGADLFGGAGSWFVDPLADGFFGRVFVSAGGADLSTFALAKGIATVTVTKIPEPATAWLLGLSCLGLFGLRRKS